MTEKDMLQQYNEIIDKQLWKHSRHHWDDLRSEAYLKFCYVRDNYNPDRGRFFSLAYKTIEMQMRNYIKVETTPLMRKNTYYTLDNYIPGGEGDSFIDLLLDDDDFERDYMLRDLLEHTVNSGNELYRKVRELYYLEGYSKGDILVSLGLNDYKGKKWYKGLLG